MDVDNQNETQGQSTQQEDKTDLFTRHVDSILCCAIDNDLRLAVSGGIDDTAFVWDINTKHVIFECVGHKESVVAASFSLNSTYVATGDLNGLIQVRNTTTGNRVFHFEIDEINWIVWHNTSDYILLAGTTKGDFWMWNVNDPVAIKTFSSYGSSTTGARLLPDGINILVSYQDGAVRKFDLRTKQSVQTFQENKAEVISIDLNPTKSIFAIGCIDSTVRLIRVSNLEVIGCLRCESDKSKIENQSNGDDSAEKSKEDDDDDDNDDSVVVIEEPVEVIDEECMSDVSSENQSSESVESVIFSSCGSYLAAANISGTVSIWDVSTQTLRSQLQTGVGVTKACWTTNGDYLTGNLDGSIRIFDKNLVQKKNILAHNDQILDLQLKGDILVTASEDKTVRVIKL